MLTAKQRTFEKKADYILMLVCVVSVFLLPSNAAFAEDYNTVEPALVSGLLTEFAAATKANYDKIKTMQATIDFFILDVYEGNDVSANLKNSEINIPVIPKRLGVIYEGTTRFKSDVAGGRNWSHTIHHKGLPYYKDMDTHEIYSNNHRELGSVRIVRPDVMMHSDPYLLLKDGTLLETRAWKSKPRERESVFLGHDHTFFYKPTGYTWVWLSSFEYLRSIGKMPTEAIILKESVNPEVEYFLKITLIDESRKILEVGHIILPYKTGFNPTFIERLDASENMTLQKFNLEYTEINGIYAPLSFHSITYGQNGNVVEEKKCVFRDVKVNEDIPDSTFSESNLGLKKGEKMIDGVDENNKKTFIYQNGVFVADVNK